MKKAFLLSLSLIMILVLFVGCDNTYKIGDTLGWYRWVKFVLDTSLPESPETLNYYSIVDPEITFESVEELGAKIGFTGEANVSQSEKMIRMSNKDGDSLEVYVDTGALVLNCSISLYELDADLTSNDDTGMIATEFIKQMGLWNDNVELKEVRVGGTVNGTPSHLVAVFSYYIDGYPLTGIGYNFSVRIGSGGSIGSAMIWQPELEAQGTIPCISVEEACEMLTDGNGIDFLLPSNCKKVVINNVYIGYYLESMTEVQESVMPVYVFEGECFDWLGDYIQGFTCYVSAVAE